MPLPILFSGLDLGTIWVDGLCGIFVAVRASRVFDNVKALMKKRAILGIAEIFLTPGDSENKFVLSPALDALRGLLSSKEYDTGVVYILYDEKGNGKSTAARALLREYYNLAPGKDIKGFMLRQETVKDNIRQALMKELDVNSVDNWMQILLHAMCEPDEEAPSILIIDGVKSLGVDDCNLTFIRNLCDSMGGKNIVVVVICQDKDVASTFCRLGNGKSIVPMPGFYTGSTLTSPLWSTPQWRRDVLIEMINVKYPGKFSGNKLDFVHDGMTPLEVIKKARKGLRLQYKAPEAPERETS